jgi:hypothetical protein
MTVHQRRLKLIEFAIGATQFECQVASWKLNNNSADGDKQYTFCPDGEFREETDPDYSLDLTFFADWRSGGISDFLTQNDGEDATFSLDHHPDVAAEHVTWTGTLRVKAPSVGGDARKTEQTQVTLMIIGQPVFTREVP